ncbi:MAG: hypothetical protein VST68_08665 [Nitrospirota bacterium]|nr:hypothetical protein [Nitrospirota bacterium]
MSGQPYTVLNVMGPYREPKEPAFSFDYSVQRPEWATPQGIRVKIAIEEELEVLKGQVLQLTGGTPGQQMRLNRILTKAIGDQKLEMANEEGMFLERFDVMIGPFTNDLAHLYPKLESWMQQERDRLRQEIKDQIGI